MYIILSATNRPGSNTLKVAKEIEGLFIAKDINPFFYTLENYSETQRGQQIQQLEANALTSATKIIIVAPEYNGTFPGIFKLLLDHSDIKTSWWYKKVMLVGVSTGRAGNLRGLDQLTNLLNYLKVNVLPNKVPLSGIQHLINSDNKIEDEATLTTLKNQIEEFIAF